MHARTKDEWRQLVLSGRRALTPELRIAEDRALVALATQGIAGGSTVCAYVPTALEPRVAGLSRRPPTGSPGRVLVPVTPRSGSAPLVRVHGRGWSRRRELRPPRADRAGVGTRRDPFGRDHFRSRPGRRPAGGVRLGRGAGFYDRTLGLAASDARLITVVRDEELVSELPEDPHDVRMGWALTPRLGPRPARRPLRTFPARNSSLISVVGTVDCRVLTPAV